MRLRSAIFIAPVALFACLAAVGLLAKPKPRAPRLMQRTERLMGTTATIAADSEALGYARTADAISSAFAEVMKVEKALDPGAPADARAAALTRAADSAAEVLRRSGVTEGRVEIGGETRTLGRERPAGPLSGETGGSRTRRAGEGAPE